MYSILNNDYKCSWCEKYIKGFHLKGCISDIFFDENDNEKQYDLLHFCGLICAKLYNDNIEPIFIDYREYNKFYVKNLLSNKQIKIFDILKGLDFKTYPYSKVFDSNIINKNALKKEYINVLLHY